MEPLAEQKGLQLTTRITIQAAIIDGDRERLLGALRNILSNAIKFTPAKGSIDVSVTLNRGFEVRVSDTGEGIDPEFLPRIFDRFAQANPMAPGQSGLGLGLTIVKYVIEAHDGKIEAFSDGLGRGATFVAVLPVIEEITDR